MDSYSKYSSANVLSGPVVNNEPQLQCMCEKYYHAFTSA